MKKPVSILKASTAMAVAVSFAGQSAIAAGPAADDHLILAQATETEGEPVADDTAEDIPLADETEAEVPLADESDGDVPLAEEPETDLPLAEESGGEVPLAEETEGEVPLATEDEADPEPAEVAPADAETADQDPADAEEAEADPADAEEADAAPADVEDADVAPADAEEADVDPAEVEATELPADDEADADAAAEADAPAETDAEETDAATADDPAAAEEETGAANADDPDAAEEENEQAISDDETEATETAVEDGQDVSVEETTSSDAVSEELEAAQQRMGDLEERLEALDAEGADGGEEEVVTDENSRSSDEEVAEDDDDDDDTWKTLGAAAAGAAVGALIPALGGRLVQDQGDRVIVERDGEFFVRKDENELLRRPGVTVRTQDLGDGLTRSVVERPDGSRVVTVRDAGGFVLRRTLIQPDGTEVVLIDEDPAEFYSFTNWDETLPPLEVDIPDDRYVVDYSRARGDMVAEALAAPPVQEIDRIFSLREVRENERVRALVPRVDLDTVQFETGSAAIRSSEVETLATLGRSMRDIVQRNPRELFLVEGHTDAVGSNLMNLALSDRRAESVALALTEHFDVPPENLVVQGYGERYLKEQTEGPSQANRRATVRRITPLIDRVAARN